MKNVVLGLACLCLSGMLNAQSIPPQLLSRQWDASWITVPDVPAGEYQVCLFRKVLELPEVLPSYVVHVSADNRYKLFVNGNLVSLGPARGDLSHWRFESVDVARYLKAGKNVIAAQVWNETDWRPEAQISLRTGFILQGPPHFTNTDNTWKCIRDESYTPLRVNLRTYYVTGPGEYIDLAKQPKHWKNADFDDSGWKNAQMLFKGVPKNVMGPYGTPNGWMLVPTPIPPMEMKQERFGRVAEAAGVAVPATFPAVKSPLTIPAHTKATLLLDQTYLTNAYPTFVFSSGKNATISLTYAEALFSKYPEKGNRNDTKGKYILGRKDSLLSDGSQAQTFTTLNFRTFRYVQMSVVTQNEPLVIDDLFSTFTGYPFRLNARLESGTPQMDKMLEIGWRTARLCAVETYMDCPYYEQLQYIADARIQALVSLFNSGDDRLLRNALHLMNESRQPEGLTLSRHPSYTPQYIPAFSLWYIGMLHDYDRYASPLESPEFIADKLPGMRQVLDYFQHYQMADGSLSGVPQWMFTDWVEAPGWTSGEGPKSPDGTSAMIDLQLLWAYQLAAVLERRTGMPAFADQYTERAAQLKKTVLNKYWKAGQKLFADDTAGKYFSQHTNALAILTGILEGPQARELAERTRDDKSLAPASIYFKYYLHQAWIKAGMGNDYLKWLDKWRENIDMGLTTWAEISEVGRARSDCHAWGSSPNIEFFRTILGIDSAAPGFSKVKIEPHLGELTNIGGRIPHPAGTLSVHYELKAGRWNVRILLPEKITGTLVWKGKTVELKAGENALVLDR